MASQVPCRIVTGSLDESDSDSLAIRVALEMAAAQQHGKILRAEDLFAQHPELAQDCHAAVRIIYEEICLRKELGEDVISSEFIGRFPQWREELSVLLDCDRGLAASPFGLNFPEVGESLGAFKIVAELGTGALGRVYLAVQPTLADRPLVLKVTPRDGQEHLSLARLQHTHIVPLYDVQDFLAQDLRVLCMPYLGGAALSSIFKALKSIPAPQRTGRDLIRALDEAQVQVAAPLPAGGSARAALARHSYTDAVCWIVACLAEALDHAHKRDLLHLDVKPSNVLVAADGQPLLLDFHLARQPLLAGEATPCWMGGTPGYMSPEQVAALAALRWRKPPTTTVDGRSDIYSLGLVMREALTGEARGEPGAAALRRANQQISDGLARIVAKCVAHDPGSRYSSAGELAADLRRHLADLPLHGVPNRSIVERLRKWHRRRPHTVGLIAMLLAVGATLFAAGAVAVTSLRQRSLQARLEEEWSREHSRSRRAQAAHDLHQVVERLRYVVDPSVLSPAEMRALDTASSSVWEARGLLTQAKDAALEEHVEQQIRADLRDLAILSADFHVSSASSAEVDKAWKQVREQLEEAEALLGSDPVLQLERRLRAEPSARIGAGRTETAAPPDLLPQSALQCYTLGRFYMRSGEMRRAAAALEQAIRLQPNSFWPQFYFGVCSSRLGRHADAVTAFSACIALEPASAPCYYNRALAFEKLGLLARVMDDYGSALRCDPRLAVAYLNRGVLHYRSHRYDEAIGDLRDALERGADPATVHYNMALVELDRHDVQSAKRDLRAALAASPAHSGALALRAKLEWTR